MCVSGDCVSGRLREIHIMAPSSFVLHDSLHENGNKVREAKRGSVLITLIGNYIRFTSVWLERKVFNGGQNTRTPIRRARRVSGQVFGRRRHKDKREGNHAFFDLMCLCVHHVSCCPLSPSHPSNMTSPGEAAVEKDCKCVFFHDASTLVKTAP